MGSPIRLLTGKAFRLGRFVLRLNLPFEAFQKLDESFCLLLSPKPVGEDSHYVKYSSYPALPEGEHILSNDSPFLYLATSVWIPLTMETSKDGKGYAECERLSRVLHSANSTGKYLSLVFFSKTKPNDGTFIFSDLDPMTAGFWNQKREDDKTGTLTDDPSGKRYIHLPCPWQPEKPWIQDMGVALWRLPEPLPHVDGHLHIQSNHTAPLPLVWDKIPSAGKNIFKYLRVGWESKNLGKLKREGMGVVGSLLAGQPGIAFCLGGLIANQFRRGDVKVGLDDISGLLFGESGKIAANSTEKIGGILSDELSNADNWNQPYVRKGKLHAFATPLPMDMHYGHFKGYFGEPIYKNENGEITFALNPFKDERGKISAIDGKLYERFSKQIGYTAKAAAKKPWSLLPLYHVDPRRWRGDGKTGNEWNTPFESINGENTPAKTPSPFIGIKMYTSLGYMPLDPLLPWQSQIYSKCEQDGIPIMNHCTTEGMYTHDKPFFYDLWSRDPALKQKMPGSPTAEQANNDLQNYLGDGKTIVDKQWVRLELKTIENKIQWFDQNYVYPSAWEPVIKAHPKLKLCLAHFCGYSFWGNKKFKNGQESDDGVMHGFPETESGSLPDPAKTNALVYALCKLVQPENQVHFDLSFFFFTKHNKEAVTNFFKWARKHKKGFLLDRILWGTDWPLVVIDDSKFKEDMMGKYVRMNLEKIMEIDPDLWLRFTVLNPMRFYGIEKKRLALEKFFKTPAPGAMTKVPTNLESLYEMRNKVVS